MTDVSGNKIVIVIDDHLDKAVTANRAAVLMSGLAAKYPEVVGNSHTTKDSKVVEGFSQLPVILLTRPEDKSYRELIELTAQSDCYYTFFLKRAEGLRSYQDYSDSISKDNLDDLDVDAMLIYGKRKKVDKLTKYYSSMR